jgi:Uma2 family endonuclease
MSVVQLGLPGTKPDPLYPDSDGRELGETDFHTAAVILLREAFEDRYAGRTDVHVASQLLLYFEQGNPSGRRDPDVMVTIGVAGNHPRRSFRVWEEGRVPNVVFEISSENTFREDLGDKRTTYEQIGIREYFLFDAENRWLNPQLQGCRIVGGTYQPIQPGPGGSLDSVELNVRLVPQGNLLRVIDLATGQMIPTRGERAEQAEERADNYRAELSRLRQQLGLPDED